MRAEEGGPRKGQQEAHARGCSPDRPLRGNRSVGDGPGLRVVLRTGPGGRASVRPRAGCPGRRGRSHRRRLLRAVLRRLGQRRPGRPDRRRGRRGPHRRQGARVPQHRLGRRAPLRRLLLRRLGRVGALGPGRRVPGHLSPRGGLQRRREEGPALRADRGDGEGLPQRRPRRRPDLRRGDGADGRAGRGEERHRRWHARHAEPDRLGQRRRPRPARRRLRRQVPPVSERRDRRLAGLPRPGAAARHRRGGTCTSPRCGPAPPWPTWTATAARTCWRATRTGG